MKPAKQSVYVVITPVRDEAPNIGHTIESFAKQTVLPAKWVIVDDGSTDATGQLADEAARHHSWIRVLHRDNRGFRKSGGGVMEAFLDGYEHVKDQPWDFIAKVDGDLSFEGNYFETCFARFARHATLGLGGGAVYEEKDGHLEEGSPGDPIFHVRGATKIYRRECWQAIGGLIQAPGWDTVDELKANMMGWRTYTFKELRVVHHKKTGSADGSWRNWVKNGRANYITGYHPLFMLVKCARRSIEKPYGIAAMGLLSGFFGCYFRGVRRIPDKALIRYVRHEQMKRLFLQSSLWNQPVLAAGVEGVKGRDS